MRRPDAPNTVLQPQRGLNAHGQPLDNGRRRCHGHHFTGGRSCLIDGTIAAQLLGQNRIRRQCDPNVLGFSCP